MNVEIISSKLQGTIVAVTSKSYTHRALIILSLLNNCGKIINPSICEDTITTMKYLNAMGVKTIIENNVITVSKQSELINPSFFHTMIIQVHQLDYYYQSSLSYLLRQTS